MINMTEETTTNTKINVQTSSISETKIEELDNKNITLTKDYEVDEEQAFLPASTMSNSTISSSELSSDFDQAPENVEIVYEWIFPQVRPVLLRVGKLEIELLEVLKSSCLVYFCVCFIWLIAIICLALSLYYEILDLVYFNIFVLAIVSAYTLIKAILICILIFHQVC